MPYGKLMVDCAALHYRLARFTQVSSFRERFVGPDDRDLHWTYYEGQLGEFRTLELIQYGGRWERLRAQFLWRDRRIVLHGSNRDTAAWEYRLIGSDEALVEAGLLGLFDEVTVGRHD